MINIGDKVRSYDFEGRTDSYVEGVIEAMGPVPELFSDCDRYTIRVTGRIAGGKPVEPEHTATHVYPPVNGTPSLMGGICEGVEKIEAGE